MGLLGGQGPCSHWQPKPLCIPIHCPGTLPRALLPEFVVHAAHDSRFPPISIQELPDLTCEVNILSPNGTLHPPHPYYPHPT